MATAVQVTFDEQLQLVREGLDKRAARNASNAALGKAIRTGKVGQPSSIDKVGEWIETEGARIEKRWGTTIADTLVANRDLYTKIKVISHIENPTIDQFDELIVWPKLGQVDNVLNLAKCWNVDDCCATNLDGQAVVRFWWD